MLRAVLYRFVDRWRRVDDMVRVVFVDVNFREEVEWYESKVPLLVIILAIEMYEDTLVFVK